MVIWDFVVSRSALAEARSFWAVVRSPRVASRCSATFLYCGVVVTSPLPPMATPMMSPTRPVASAITHARRNQTVTAR